MQVTINGRMLDQQITEMMHYSQKMATLVSEIESIKITTASHAGSGQSIMSKWKRVAADSKAHSATLQKLHSTLDGIQTEYLACESRLCGQEYVEAEHESDSLTEISWLSPDWSAAWSMTKKAIKGFGTVGSSVAAIIGMSEGGESFAKNTAKLVGSGAKLVQKMADGKTVDWFGKLQVGKPSLKKELSKYIYDPSKCETVVSKNASKIGAAVQWVGLAFDGLLNFKDNMDEFNGDFSNSRMYAETVVETGIDFTVGIGTSLIATAIVGSTAPVWAAGVAAVGIVGVTGSIVSEFVEAKWGIDLKETVSDFVVDIGEKAVDTVKTAGKAVGKAVSGTAKKISAGWKKMWGG